jgi:type 1 glutamine amidotransferase
MREALIVWGGWPGHEPEKGARIIESMLTEEGFKVQIEASTSAFLNRALPSLSLIVPIYTMAQIEKPEAIALAGAVESGVGLGGYHGGMADAFRSSTEYQFVVGGQWVAHPGNIVDYQVDVKKSDDPIMKGIAPFAYRSEQYYMHIDPSNEVLATTTFNGPLFLDRRHRYAGRLEAAPRHGPRLLLIPRSCGERIRSSRDENDCAARPSVGGARVGSASRFVTFPEVPV